MAAASFRVLAVHWLFFLSGLSGLVYEVVWIRMLGFVMGNTVLSVTTVLATFMGGLALGSYLGGRVADRLRRPILAYAVLELAIGIVGILVPFLIGVLKPLHVAAYAALGDSILGFGAAQFVLAGVVLLVPTTFMGATLPILSKHGVRSIATLGGSVGRLYAVNTFGAVVGALATGFLLMPLAGTWGTIVVAAALNVAIAVAAFVLSRRAGESAGPAPRPLPAAAPAAPAARPPALAPLLVAFGLVGFASMVDQVAWTRVLSLVLGSSVYAFSLMVGAFILGLALGGAAVSQLVDRIRRPALTLAVLQALVAAASAVLLPVFNALPSAMLSLVLGDVGHENFLAVYGVRFGLVFVCLLVPTALMGAVFPFVARIAATSEDRVGRTVGSVYAANTLGAIAGAFAGGFLLVPFLGLRGSLLVAAALNLVVAALLAGPVARARGEGAKGVSGAFSTIAAGGAVLALVGFLSPWDASRLSSGVYLYGVRYRDEILSGKTSRDFLFDVGELVHYEEGMTATVSVRKVEDVYALLANGKTDASTSYDMQTQVLLAHIPPAMARSTGNALVIGVASGITAGSVACHPFESIDGVEISPEIVEAAKMFFSPFNNRVFDDPRFRLVVGDGRNFLDLRDERYDVVNNQPSNLWIAGIGNLFTREFFEVARARLAPGGVVAQWVNIYDLRPEHFKTVVRTFANVFPHVTLWELQRGADYLLLGGEEEQKLDLARFEARLSAPRVMADLARVGVTDRAALAARFIASDGALRSFAGEGVENTDDNGNLEYAAPRVLHKRMSDENVAAIDPIIQPIETIASGDRDAVARLAAEVEKRRRARAELNEADRLISANRGDEAMVLQERALAALPEETAVRESITIVAITRAQERLGKGDNSGALLEAARVERLEPDNVDALNIRAHAYLAAGRLADAIPVLERVRRLRPASAEAVLNLSTVYMNLERTREARAALEEFERAGHKLDADLRYNMGCILLKDGDAAGAIRQFNESLRLKPDPNVRQALDAARRAVREAPADGDGSGGGGM